MNTLATILKIFLLLGTFLFGGVFIYSFTSPQKIEKDASGFIKKQIQQKIEEKIDALGENRVKNKMVALSQKMLVNNNEHIAKIKLALKENLPQKIASAIAVMQHIIPNATKNFLH